MRPESRQHRRQGKRAAKPQDGEQAASAGERRDAERTSARGAPKDAYEQLAEARRSWATSLLRNQNRQEAPWRAVFNLSFYLLREYCRDQLGLQDRADEVEEKALERVTEISERYYDRVMSREDLTHLLLCCLYLGAYDGLILGGRLSHSDALATLNTLDFSRHALRALAVVNYYFLMTATLVADAPTTAAGQLRNMAVNHYGPGMGVHFEAALDERRRVRSFTLQVHDCFYRKVMSAEHAPDLLDFVCCRRDSVMHKGMERLGVGLEHKVAGDGITDPRCCSLRVYRRPPVSTDGGESD
ncbi:unnamed protein product [Pedinophyceae sp. YPF-701]|nr:unnamed protein product [Pedinophyceae sp. YPF-701]